MHNAHRVSHQRLPSGSRTAYVWLALIVTMLLGCQNQAVLMPTPNLYARDGVQPFAHVPDELRGSKVELLYVTDREPEKQPDGTLHYGYGRSASLAWGGCVVDLGKGTSWKDLAAASCEPTRSVKLSVTLEKSWELGRFPKTPPPLLRTDEGFVDDPASIPREKEAAAKLRDEIRSRLKLTPRKEAFVMVHGCFATFDDAAVMMGELWHFLGREGVPIVYTWPAGYESGPLRSYTYDRESGEFTVTHLKQFLRTLASCEEVGKIHLITHSRGTHVATSALRELFIEANAAGLDVKKTYKIGNVILAAADLDFDIVKQRLCNPRLGRWVDRVTVYVSKSDEEIGLASWLFQSQGRIGRLRAEDLSGVTTLPQTQVIDVDVRKSGRGGHYYFYESPSVSSDLIMVLRYNRDPGAENGRPLIMVAPGYWRLEEGYPNVKKN